MKNKLKASWKCGDINLTIIKLVLILLLVVSSSEYIDINNKYYQENGKVLFK